MFNTTPEEAMASFSSLSFKGKRIIANLYDRARFTYVAEVTAPQEIQLKGFFTIQGKEIETVDHLFSGPPPGFIKGAFLYFIGTEVRYKELSQLPRSISPLELRKLRKGEVEVIVLGEELLKDEKILILKDRVGVTAAINDSEYEPELLITSYKKTPYAADPYACPSDKIFESLEMLTSAGWTIKNYKGQEVVPLTHCEFTYKVEDEIVIEGELTFGNDKVPLSLDKEVPLPGNKVGLLPNNFKLAPLLKKASADKRGVTVPKNLIGLLTSLLPTRPLEKGILPCLRPYQVEGVSWLSSLYTQGFSGLLADDMGLGKTLQALALIAQKPDADVLIVMPTTLLFNWREEIKRFLPGTPFTIYHGVDRIKPAGGIVLTSYALLRQDREFFSSHIWDMVILDEAQAIKNTTSDTFKAAISIPSRFRLSMTGTPLENRLSELHAHFHFLMPGLIESQEDPLYTRKKIAPFLLRRTKAQVLKELPDKIEETILVEMSERHRAAYDDFLANVQHEDLVSKSRMEILEIILRLRQIACHPRLAGLPLNESSKLEMLLSDIDQIVQEKNKVIIFSQFTSMLQLITPHLTDYLYLDGQTRNREEIINQFQNGSTQVLLMSLKAGGVGLNLTQADYVLIFDPWWNDAVEQQAISRAHRMGRQGTVIAKRYIARGTIEEKIQLLKQSKKKLAEDMFSEGGISLTEMIDLIR